VPARIVGIRQRDGQIEAAWLSVDGTVVTPIAELQAFWTEPQRLAKQPTAAMPSLPVESVKLVPPVLPDARVLCVGLNYKSHADEGSYSSQTLPEHPTLFARFARTLSVDGASVPIPIDEDGLDWEGEVVAWVGEYLADATPEDALSAVIGYSSFNDITARKAQKRTSQWTLGKNADRTGILGPMTLVSDVGSLEEGLRIRTRVNGELMQDGSTRDMIYGVGETLAHISRTLTLYPGDLLATGTPSGVGYARKPPRLLRAGDVVEVDVDRLGCIRNPIVGHEHRSSVRGA
jgi:2-keto-4-pentenoate hydratase/2-oxohepta-3-ene-1,7-dioic acid hydratase in catechol pathway